MKDVKSPRVVYGTGAFLINGKNLVKIEFGLRTLADLFACRHGQVPARSAAAAACGATETVRAEAYLPFQQLLQVKAENRHRLTDLYLQPQHLVEIAIVKASVVAHADEMTADQLRC